MVGSPPRSEWDIAGEKWAGYPASEGFHWMPTLDRTLGFYEKSSEELYAEDCAKPGHPLRFTLDQARTIKHAYWSGERTIISLAEENACTTVTISRIVHGKTMWYS